MASLLPWIRLLRPQNGAISYVGTVVGGLSVSGLFNAHLGLHVPLLLLAGLTTFLVTSGGNVLNDYLDVEGDIINHPDRPLPKGEVSRHGARSYAVILFALSAVPLIPFFPIGGSPFAIPMQYLLAVLLIWGTSIAALTGYELWWKARGIVGNALVAYLTGAVFLFGAATVGLPLLALPFLFMAFLASLSREITKDMEDIEGDSDRITFPKRYGLSTGALVGRVSVTAAIAISPLPLLIWLPLYSIGGVTYLAIVMVSDLFFVLSVAWLPERLHREQGLSKLAMVFALASFMGAALR